MNEWTQVVLVSHDGRKRPTVYVHKRLKGLGYPTDLFALLAENFRNALPKGNGTANTGEKLTPQL